MKSLMLPDVVQRLSPQPASRRSGFDRYFSLEYMGSSEYEWGAPAASLKHLRASGPLVVSRHDLTIDDLTRPIWVVCPKRDEEDRIAALRAWSDTSTTEAFRSREITYFHEAFTESLPDYQETIAWWDLRLHFGWALDESIAQNLLKGFLGE